MDQQRPEAISDTNKEVLIIQKNSIKDVNENKILKWGNRQKVRYLIFLVFFQKHLEKSKLLNKMDWYSAMSMLIGNTNSQNCGQYHRNYLKKFNNIQGIINHLRETVLDNKQKIIPQIQRIEKFIMDSKVQRQIKLQKIFQQKSINQQVNIVKFEDVNSKVEFFIQSDREKDQLFLDQHPFQINIPVQVLTIIRRERAFKNSNLSDQQEKINNSIRMFKTESQHLQKFKKSKSLKNRKNSNLFKKKILTMFGNSQIENYQVNTKQFQRNQSFQILQKTKKRKLKRWTKDQNQKLLLFLNIIKEDLKQMDAKKNLRIHVKISQFVNTDKTPKECAMRILHLLEKYDKSLMLMIQKQTQRFMISQDFIEKARQRYNFQLQNPLQIKMNLQCPLIRCKVPIENDSKDPKLLMKQELNVQRKTLFSLQQKYLQNLMKIDDANQQDQKKQENQKYTCNKKFKHIFELNIDNQAFYLFRNKIKENIIFKNRNLIIYVIKTLQKVQLEKKD